ncbi:MAG: hypothetical protein ACFFCS_14390 [Candidatus Hodarchaeota archaeon]
MNQENLYISDDDDDRESIIRDQLFELQNRASAAFSEKDYRTAKDYVGEMLEIAKNLRDPILIQNYEINIRKIDSFIKIPSERGEVATKPRLKCISCLHNYYKKDNFLKLKENKDFGHVSVSFTPDCGYRSEITINKNFEFVEHKCEFYKKDMLQHVDVDEFLDGDGDLDFLIKSLSRGHRRTLDTHEPDLNLKEIKRPPKKKPVGLIPTEPEFRSEEQDAQVEAEMLSKMIETDDNLPYLRILAFEKLAVGQNAYDIDDFSEKLKNLDKELIIGFIEKIDNEFLISYSEEKKAVHFFNPSSPEIEILSREFEKWLRFNRL